MIFNRVSSWEEVAKEWRAQEEGIADWDESDKILGWPDWDSWRFQAIKHLHLQEKSWQIFDFTNPSLEMDKVTVGPYKFWQNLAFNTENLRFSEILQDEDNVEFFKRDEKVQQILTKLPFDMTMIGAIRRDTNTIICIDGHYRMISLLMAKKYNIECDFSKMRISIALADFNPEESQIFNDYFDL